MFIFHAVPEKTDKRAIIKDACMQSYDRYDGKKTSKII